MDRPPIDFYESMAKRSGRAAVFVAVASLLMEDRNSAEKALLLITFLAAVFLIFRFIFRQAVFKSFVQRGIYSYTRPSRMFIRVYALWAFIGAVGWAGQARTILAGQAELGTVATLFVFTAAAFIAAYYSSRLVAAQVSDLNFVKGTSTCRESVIYSSSLLLILLVSFSGYNQLSGWFGSALISAAGVIGVARLVGSGYKEFREALDSASKEKTKYAV